MCNVESPWLLRSWRYKSLEHCVAFLRHYPDDLRSCALVSHRWAFAAQRQIFQTIDILHARSRHHWTRLKTVLLAFLHLGYILQYIRRLGVMTTSSLPLPETFADICAFPFANLEVVDIGSSPLTDISRKEVEFCLSTQWVGSL